MRIFNSFFILALAAGSAGAQSLADFTKRVTEFTLPNGLHFIVLERHDAPVVSFHTYVNAGAVDDPKGKTGLAHMFEHMAFKGTETLGSTNWLAEKKAMAAIEGIYDSLEAEKKLGVKGDAAKLNALQERLGEAVEQASEFVVPNLYVRIIEENGGVGMNAGTGEDSTDYFYNFPANRMELWFYLEAGRFLRPVYREFYKERDVVREERRMRVESDPNGKLMEALQSTAMAAHPYRNGPGGWASDIENLRVGDAEKFYQKYYVASNMTIAVVGDVDPKEVKRMATLYFGRLPKRPLPDAVVTVEPVQEGGKRVEVTSPAQPTAYVAYHRPDQYSADDPVFDMVSAILSGGRTSMLYRDLVRDKKIALGADTGATFPGGKYPNLFLFVLTPNTGHTVEECEKAADAVIRKLQAEKVDAATLERVKTKTRAGLIHQLDSNSGLATLLTQYAANYGDWKKLFTSIDDIEKVTAEDVQRVARKYFVPENKTVALTVQGETK